MSKTIRFHQLGGPEVLKLEDTPLQQPGKGEVRLQAQAVGLNRAEYMFMHGQYLESTDLPARIGYEAAGVVDAVGPDVDPGWVGRKVSTLPAFSMNHYGALAEQPIVPAYAIAEYPDTLSAVDGAAIWMQYLTVYSSLVAIGQLTKGDFVLITAASSSVGIAAIQTVRAEGAVSIATTRTGKKKDQLFGLGADHVIATEEEDVAARVHEITGDKGTRLALDPIGGAMLQKAADAAAVGGIIFEYGALSEEPTIFPLVQALTKNLTVRGYWLPETTLDPEKRESAKKYVYDRLKKGVFHPSIAKTFPLAETVEAYRYLESNNQVGKVVITVP